MPDSGQPQVPNYVNGVGRLVTDRFDFEKHILGTDFRHNADAIDVKPNLVVGSTTCTNVLEALEALAANIVTPSVPLATQTAPGIIRLSGDLGGINTTGLAPIVSGIQGRPIQNLTPTTGQVLTWNGSFWGPANSAAGFSAGGDLTGTPTAQYIQSLSGSNGSGGAVTLSATSYISAANNQAILKIAGNTVLSSDSTNDIALTSAGEIDLLATNSFVVKHNNNLVLHLAENGSDSIVLGDTVANSSNIGLIRTSNNGGAGQIIIGINNGGSAGLLSVDASSNTTLSGTNGGSVYLNYGSTRIFGAGSQGISLGNSPSFGGGSGVFFLQNALSGPSVGPTGGALLYALSGDLWVTQSDGTTFKIQSGSFSAGGDLSGSSTSQTVVGIQHNPISAAVPTVGQVLEWSGTAWTPTTLSGGSVTWNNDLLGSTNSNQYVTGLSGHAGGGGAITLASTAYISGGSNQKYIANGSTLIFGTDSLNNTVINAPSTDEVKMQINGVDALIASSSSVSAVNEFVVLGGGAADTCFQVNTYISPAIAAAMYFGGITNYAIYSDGINLFLNAPSSTGVLGLSVGNTSGINPPPASMSYLPWSGTLNTQKQSISSVPVLLRTISTSATTAYSYTVANNTVVTFDVVAVAKFVGSLSNTNCGAMKYCATFVNSSGTVSQCGSTTQIYNQGMAGGGSVLFSISGSTVLIQVAAAFASVDWQLFVSINDN